MTMPASCAFRDCLMNTIANNFFASLPAVQRMLSVCGTAACGLCLPCPAAAPPRAGCAPQTGSEVGSSWQLHLPARSCWHAPLSSDLELPKQDVIEANSFAGHLLPLGFFPSLLFFFEKGKQLSRTVNVKCI